LPGHFLDVVAAGGAIWLADEDGTRRSADDFDVTAAFVGLEHGDVPLRGFVGARFVVDDAGVHRLTNFASTMTVHTFATDGALLQARDIDFATGPLRDGNTTVQATTRLQDGRIFTVRHDTNDVATVVVVDDTDGAAVVVEGATLPISIGDQPRVLRCGARVIVLGVDTNEAHTRDVLTAFISDDDGQQFTAVPIFPEGGATQLLVDAFIAPDTCRAIVFADDSLSSVSRQSWAVGTGTRRSVIIDIDIPALLP